MVVVFPFLFLFFLGDVGFIVETTVTGWLVGLLPTQLIRVRFLGSIQLLGILGENGFLGKVK